MKWEFDNDRPIYLQVVEIITAEIMAGNYKAGEKFPSVRELAVLASVNPNTMQKALSELERSGFLITNRSAARVVTEDLGKIQAQRDALANEKISQFLGQMDKLGFTKEEIILKIGNGGRE